MMNSLIVKHNNLIQARYNLNLVEQKIILYAVSKLDRDKENFNILSLDIREFYNMLNTTQERHTETKNIVRGLRKKEIIIDSKERELIVGWLASIDYIKDEGRIELEFSEKLIPYLLQLQEKFTRYELRNVLYLKNKHSLRVYELLKQYEKIGKREFTLEELRRYLCIKDSEYTRFDNFSKRVLDTAKDEINNHTDLVIEYEKIREGRKISKILFSIKSKNEDREVYIEYLKEFYNIKEIKKKMGLAKENFSAEQIMAIYEKTINKLNGRDTDPFEYVGLNYRHIKEKARNRYAYLLKALEEDYARAIGQMRLDSFIE